MQLILFLLFGFANSVIAEDECPGPFPGFPSCENRITWLMENWKKDDKKREAYTKNGISDTRRCIMQYYLYWKEGHCPPVDQVCKIKLDQDSFPGYPKCVQRIEWLLANWETVKWSDKYREKGITSSDPCIMQTYLNKHEVDSDGQPFCPPVFTKKPTPAPTSKPTLKPTKQPTKQPTEENDCTGDFPNHSHCEGRIAWMMKKWDSVSWSQKYRDAGITKSDRCQMQKYLNEYEGDEDGPYCPPVGSLTNNPTQMPTSRPSCQCTCKNTPPI
mmetsp:Transcript_14070/g.24961  ORF Transcript_14070/g.24961 Transcript_14070/m.24961 type:complete len:272 (+) Transcript_14070:367-1182(+)